MQSWDGWLHVNPFAYGAGNDTNVHKEVGVAMIFNPTNSMISVSVSIPLYYTGLTTSAMVQVDESNAEIMALERDFSVHIPMTMAPMSIHTVVFQRPGEQLPTGQ